MSSPTLARLPRDVRRELYRPRVLLVDLGLPDGSGLELIAQAEAHNAGTQSLVITVFGDEQHVLAAIEAGAVGYVLKDSGAGEIARAIQNVLKHAHARAVRVSTGEVIHPTLGNALYIEIDDDGRGFSGTTPSGRGLANMRDRAQELGGVCEVQSDRSGTTVRLYIAVG